MKAEWFAGRLRELREAAGLTQQQLAARAGMAGRSITHLEGGDRKPTWETVLTLCGVLGVGCVDFAKEPTAQSAPRRGRPRKVAATPSTPPAGDLEATQADKAPPGVRRRKGKAK